MPPTDTTFPRFRRWFDEHRDELDAVVFDIDGVLIKGRAPVPGARETIAHVRACGIPFALLTNDGCHSPEQKSAFLRDCCIDVAPEGIVSASHGLAELTEANGWLGDDTCFVMGSLGEPCYAERIGLVVTRDLGRLPECRAIIVGEKRYDWFETITAVFNRLTRPDGPCLIVPNPDEYWPQSPDTFGIGSGAIARLLQRLCAAHGIVIEPLYLGKPYLPIFQVNHHKLEQSTGRNIPRQRVIMLGDSLASDIPGAAAFGYRTGLVMTGITTPQALEHHQGPQPDLVFETL